MNSKRKSIYFMVTQPLKISYKRRLQRTLSIIDSNRLFIWERRSLRFPKSRATNPSKGSVPRRHGIQV